VIALSDRRLLRLLYILSLRFGWMVGAIFLASPPPPFGCRITTQAQLQREQKKKQYYA
jgi:hypothetical protein